MDQFMMKWEKIPQIYPLFVFTVITFIAYILSLDAFFVIMLIVTALQFMFFCFMASHNWAKRNEEVEETDDDPSGNSNISKKFFDHM